jgi:hypothetical protein
MDLVRFLSTIVGLVIILATFYWAARILMVKGTDPPLVARFIFRLSRNALHFIGNRMSNKDKRRELWALYIPFSLLAVLGCSIAFATVGYTLLLYGVTQNSMRVAYVNSVSSMSVLGIGGQPKTLLETTIAGIEAFTGPTFVALLVAYTVTIYSAYSDHRVQLDAMDTGLSGNADAVDLLVSAARGPGLGALDQIWADWITDFKQLEKIYRTVDGYLLLFAPNMSRHWSTDAPLVLDAAALRNSLVAGPPDSQAAECIDYGAAAISHLAHHYRHRVFSLRTYSERPTIGRAEFDACARSLANAGVTVRSDLDQAWVDFETASGRYTPQVALLTRMLPSHNRQ